VQRSSQYRDTHSLTRQDSQFPPALEAREQGVIAVLGLQRGAMSNAAGQEPATKKHVVIVGGGFAGLNCDPQIGIAF